MSRKCKNYWPLILIVSLCYLGFLIWLASSYPVVFGLLAGATVLWIAYSISKAETVPANEPFLPGDASIMSMNAEETVKENSSSETGVTERKQITIDYE